MEELPKLEYEISVLSPLQPIDPEDVEVGKHGLVVTFGGTSWSAAAAGPCGTWLGSRDLPGADLRESRLTG